jgi:hypothetical protein
MIYDVTLATVTAMLFPTHTHFAVFSFEFIQPKRFAKKTNHNLVHTDFTDLLNIAKKTTSGYAQAAERGGNKKNQTNTRERGDEGRRELRPHTFFLEKNLQLPHEFPCI